MSQVGEAGWQQVIWQPKLDGLVHDVPIKCFVRGDPSVHLYLGYGEEALATRYGVTLLAGLGLDSAGVVLPFHHLEPTAANLELIAVEAPLAVAEALNQKAGKAPDAEVDLIAKSQGGGVALMTAGAAPERYGALALIAPAGLTREALGDTPLQRRWRFLGRFIIENGLDPTMDPRRDPGNVLAIYEVSRRMIGDILGGRLKAKLDFALSMNLAGQLASLSEDHPARLFAGMEDSVFRLAEYAQSLGKVSCLDLIEPIAGPHAPTLNAAGAEQLLIAGRWIRSLVAS